jgi:alkylhydroperoxidase family enzyme
VESFRLTGARVYSIAPGREVEHGLRAIGDNGAVAHIRLIDVEEATGELRAEYDAAVGRAGKVFNIVKAMSLRPRVLRAAMELYKEVMYGRSELSRADRELLAVVVSCENSCHY